MRIYSFHRRKMSICQSFGLFILDNHDIGLITVHASGHLEYDSETASVLAQEIAVLCSTPYSSGA